MHIPAQQGSSTTRTFFTYCYETGHDRWFGQMCNGLDLVELYRKTSATPNVKVTEEELRMMEGEIVPYSTW